MTNWLVLAIFLLAAGLIYACLWARATGGRRFPDWVAFRVRRPVPWTWVDVLLAFGLYLVLQTSLASLAARWVGAEGRLSPLVLLAAATGSLLSLVLSSSAIVILTKASADDLGWSRYGGFWRDVKIGVAAFVLIGPPVYAVQTLLALIFRPSQHPLITRLQEAPSAGLYLSACLVAVVAAPWVEEYLFRGLLQGWLEKVGGTGVRPLNHGPAAAPGHDSAAFPDSVEPGVVQRDYDARQRNREASNPYVTPLAETAAREPSNLARPARPPWWPVWFSAAAFSLMHLRPELDPDCVALFLLALGLGYLYRQTHRLTPCIVVHMLLNGCSMVILGLSIWIGSPP